MYSLGIGGRDGEEVSVIGQFHRLEDSTLVLRCMDREIPVRHKGLEQYKTGVVRVRGVVEDGVLVEDSVHPIGTEFDFGTYTRFVDVASRYPNLF